MTELEFLYDTLYITTRSVKITFMKQITYKNS